MNAPSLLIRDTPARRNGARRGFTLIEMVVALGIAVTLFAAVVLSVRAVTGAKAKESSADLAGVMRSLYDSANLTGKTCRLVFDLPDLRERDSDDKQVHYRAECAKSGIASKADRTQEEKDDSEARRKGKDQLKNDKRFRRLDSNDAPTVQELMEREKSRVEEVTKFSDFTDEEIAERVLPRGVKVTVWTNQLREPAKNGVAYVYFFPQGYTERAQVVFKMGDNAWTVKLSPLTGKTSIVGEELEVPKP